MDEEQRPDLHFEDGKHRPNVRQFSHGHSELGIGLAHELMFRAGKDLWSR